MRERVLGSRDSKGNKRHIFQFNTHSANDADTYFILTPAYYAININYIFNLILNTHLTHRKEHSHTYTCISGLECQTRTTFKALSYKRPWHCHHNEQANQAQDLMLHQYAGQLTHSSYKYILTHLNWLSNDFWFVNSCRFPDCDSQRVLKTKMKSPATKVKD